MSNVKVCRVLNRFAEWLQLFSAFARSVAFLFHGRSVLRHERHDLFGCCWPDVPIPLRLFRPNEFAVVSECYPAVVMTKLQRGCGSVLEVRQVIAGEAVSRRVVRPFLYASGLSRLFEGVQKTKRRRDAAFEFTERKQPLAQIRLYRHESALRCLSLRGCNFDQSALEVDLLPIESLQLCAAQSGEESDRDVRQNVWRSYLEQSRSLVDAENPRRCCRKNK